VTTVNPPNFTPPWNRSRVTALVGIGGFIILAGVLAPKLLAPLPEATGDSSSAKSDSSTSSGESTSEKPQQPVEGTPLDVLRPIEQVVIGVSLVVTVGLAGAWFVRRQRSLSMPPGPALLNVIAALPLRQNCWAYLVEAEGHQFLAGVDPSGIKSVLSLPSAPQEPVEEPRVIASPMLAPTVFPPLVYGGKR
jgi:flagellar biogenesis protein FliO